MGECEPGGEEELAAGEGRDNTVHCHQGPPQNPNLDLRHAEPRLSGCTGRVTGR